MESLQNKLDKGELEENNSNEFVEHLKKVLSESNFNETLRLFLDHDYAY